MEKAIERFRQLIFFTGMGIPAILPLYVLLREELRSILPLPIFLQFQRILLPTIAISFWVFLFPALLTLKSPNSGHVAWFVIRSVGLLLGIPFFCIFSYGIFLHGAPETIYNSAQLDNHHYHLTGTVDDFVTYEVYRCNEKDLECEIIFHDSGGTSITSPVLVVNRDSKEIGVYRDERLIYRIKSEP